MNASKPGDILRLRQRMVNFSVVGRNASSNLRDAYDRWDLQSRERMKISFLSLSDLYPDLEVAIEGSRSVDIYPSGKNKAQVVKPTH